jgi:hypothetical protein
VISLAAARTALLVETTSRLNKIHLAIGWAHFYGWPIEWRWEGQPFRSRVGFRFGANESFVSARSFDDDVRPTLKFGKEKRDE